jgi:predicted transcriptional regulator
MVYKKQSYTKQLERVRMDFNNKQWCSTPNTKIASDIGMSRHQVKRIFDKLEERGLIQREEHNGYFLKRCTSSWYDYAYRQIKEADGENTTEGNEQLKMLEEKNKALVREIEQLKKQKEKNKALEGERKRAQNKQKVSENEQDKPKKVIEGGAKCSTPLTQNVPPPVAKCSTIIDKKKIDLVNNSSKEEEVRTKSAHTKKATKVNFSFLIISSWLETYNERFDASLTTTDLSKKDSGQCKNLVPFVKKMCSTKGLAPTEENFKAQAVLFFTATIQMLDSGKYYFFKKSGDLVPSLLVNRLTDIVTFIVNDQKNETQNAGSTNQKFGNVEQLAKRVKRYAKGHWSNF